MKQEKEKTLQEKYAELVREEAREVADHLQRHAGLNATHLAAYQDAGDEHALRFTLHTTLSPAELKTKVRTALVKAGLHTPPRLGIRTSREANGPTNLILHGTTEREIETLAALHDELKLRNKSVVRRVIGMAPEVKRQVGKRLGRVFD